MNTFSLIDSDYNIINAAAGNVTVVTNSTGYEVSQRDLEEGESLRNHHDVDYIVGQLLEELVTSVSLELETGEQVIQESGEQVIQEPGEQVIQESGEQVIQESREQVIQETERTIAPYNSSTTDTKKSRVFPKKNDSMKTRSETKKEFITAPTLKENRKTGTVTRSKSTMTHNDINIFTPSTDEESYDYVIQTLQAKKREAKVSFNELRNIIRNKFRAEIPNLRRILNIAVKNGQIEKSKGINRRINYEIAISGKKKETAAKKPKQQNAIAAGNSELKVEYKQTATTSFFSVKQNKPDASKYFVLEALREMKQKSRGISAKMIREHVNSKQRIPLKEVKKILDDCVSSGEVLKVDGAVELYKLIT